MKDILGEKTVKEKNLLPELLLEMGMRLGFDLDKPVTSAVYLLSCNTDNERDNGFARVLNNKK